jgi:hypothetical protein
MTSVVDRIKESDWKSLAGVIGALSSSTIAITDQLELHPVVKVVAIAAMFTLSILLFRNTIVRALMCVVGLFTLAFFAYSYTEALLDPPPGTCWFIVQNRASKLSEKLNSSSLDMMDLLYSHGLIDSKRRNSLYTTFLQSREFDSYHLLTTVLPWKGEEGYNTFSCILQQMTNFSTIGKEICDQCSDCRFKKCHKNVSAPFFFDSSCSQFLSDKNATDRYIFVDISIDVNYLDVQLQGTSAVLSALLRCSDDTVRISLTVDTEEDAVDQKRLRKNLADYLGVLPSKVEVNVTRRVRSRQGRSTLESI